MIVLSYESISTFRRHISVSGLRAGMRVLFVCGHGVDRSRTAAALFPHLETRYKGVYENLVRSEDLDWADVLITMEPAHTEEIRNRFPAQYVTTTIHCLDIEDFYQYQQPELVKVLRQKLKETMPELFSD